MHNFKLMSAWVPLLAGLILILLAARTSNTAILLALLPGVLMIAGGVRCLLFTDLRAPQLVAIGSVLGMVAALPLWLLAGGGPGLVTLAVSVIAFLSGGWFQIRLRPDIEGVPAPAPSPPYSARVALDDAVLGVMAALTPPSTPTALREAVEESEAAYQHYSNHGYLEDPARFHSHPPLISSPDLRSLQIRGEDCDKMQFASEFEPETGLPGRERWMSYAENHTAHALLLRRDEPGPWLVCVHGFGMGNPEQDFRTLRTAHIHHTAGLNIALFTLPVHGPRAPKGVNGEKFFGNSAMDFVHAETQAIWDLRRLIAWIRDQGATRVGVLGLSLGAYTSALLAGIEDDLACVIAGVPPTDMVAHREYLASSHERRLASIAGTDMQRERALYRVVAPLELAPRVPHCGRFIFASTADQFVPVEQIHALWQHWERPHISWCTGGHISALMQRAPRSLVDEALSLSFGDTVAQTAPT